MQERNRPFRPYVLEESFTTKFDKCPKCGGKLEIHVTRQLGMKKKRGQLYWCVSHCTEEKCDFWEQGNKNL